MSRFPGRLMYRALRNRASPLLLVVALGLCLLQVEVGAQIGRWSVVQDQSDFVVDDQVISDPGEQSLVDMEFNQRDGLIAWQDDKNNLWIASVDPVTGDFIPRSGKGVLVATGLVPITETYNGPEWVETEDGMELIFSLQGRTRQLGHAWRTGSGWTWAAVSKSRFRYSPYGSKDPGDPAPRILYWRDMPAGRRAYWRELDDPSTEQMISDQSIVYPTWVDGARAIVMNNNFNGVKQCIWYDIDSGEMTPISTDAGNKRYGRAWRAPEYGNAWVSVCVDTAGEQLSVYRKAGAVWERIGLLTPPSGTSASSIEYFVHNGRSYLLMVTDVSEKNRDVWIVGIDFDNPFQRRVNAPVPMDRRDAEVFVTANGPFVYYEEPSADCVCKGLIHRAATGLGPPR